MIFGYGIDKTTNCKLYSRDWFSIKYKKIPFKIEVTFPSTINSNYIDEVTTNTNSACINCSYRKKCILFADCHYMVTCLFCCESILDSDKKVCPRCKTKIIKNPLFVC